MKLIKQNKFDGNIKLSIIKKALALGFAATTLFSLSSCKSNYEYVTNPDTGIISLEGSLPYEYLEECKVLQYKDVYDNEKIMIVEFETVTGVYGISRYITDIETGQRIGSVLGFGEKIVSELTNEKLGEFVSIENFSKYLNAYGFRKDRYTAEDINQIIKLIEEYKLKEESTKVLVKQ